VIVPRQRRIEGRGKLLRKELRECGLIRWDVDAATSVIRLEPNIIRIPEVWPRHLVELDQDVRDRVIAVTHGIDRYDPSKRYQTHDVEPCAIPLRNVLLPEIERSAFGLIKQVVAISSGPRIVWKSGSRARSVAFSNKIPPEPIASYACGMDSI
jgi:hypothetical protein